MVVVGSVGTNESSRDAYLRDVVIDHNLLAALCLSNAQSKKQECVTDCKTWVLFFEARSSSSLVCSCFYSLRKSKMDGNFFAYTPSPDLGGGNGSDGQYNGSNMNNTDTQQFGGWQPQFTPQGQPAYKYDQNTFLQENVMHMPVPSNRPVSRITMLVPASASTSFGFGNNQNQRSSQ